MFITNRVARFGFGLMAAILGGLLLFAGALALLAALIRPEAPPQATTLGAILTPAGGALLWLGRRWMQQSQGQ
jgi:uncharacterized membrane protein YgdD (TMEM256/DUF423 family)